MRFDISNIMMDKKSFYYLRLEAIDGSGKYPNIQKIMIAS